MSRRRTVRFFVALCLVAVPSTAQFEDLLDRRFGSYFSLPNASASMDPRYAPGHLVVENLEPRGRLSWLMVGRDYVGRSALQLSFDSGGIVANDAGGSPEIGREKGIPRQAIFFLFDEAREEALFFAKDPQLFGIHQEASNRLDVEAKELTLTTKNPLIVWHRRKGSGTWFLAPGDGGPLDQDGVGNRSITVALEDFEPVGPGKRKPPDSMASGDYFFVVDRRSLDAYYLEVP